MVRQNAPFYVCLGNLRASFEAHVENAYAGVPTRHSNKFNGRLAQR